MSVSMDAVQSEIATTILADAVVVAVAVAVMAIEGVVVVLAISLYLTWCSCSRSINLKMFYHTGMDASKGKHSWLLLICDQRITAQANACTYILMIDKQI